MIGQEQLRRELRACSYGLRVPVAEVAHEILPARRRLAVKKLWIVQEDVNACRVSSAAEHSEAESGARRIQVVAQRDAFEHRPKLIGCLRGGD